MEYCDGGDLMKRINMQRGVLFDEDKVGVHFKELLPLLVVFCLFVTRICTDTDPQKYKDICIPVSILFNSSYGTRLYCPNNSINV